MNLFEIFCRENGLIPTKEKLEDPPKNLFIEYCEAEYLKRLNDTDAVEISWDYLQKGLIKLLHKYEDGNSLNELSKEFRTIFNNSITFAFKKQNPNMAALTDKILEILNNLSKQNKVYVYQKAADKKVIAKSHTKKFVLADSKAQELFSYKIQEHKKAIFEYIKQTGLDHRYALIINPPTENETSEKTENLSTNDLEITEETKRTKSFNCTKAIREVIEDFFTETTPPRTTADYIWRAYQAAKVISEIYQKNYDIRLTEAQKKVNESLAQANEARRINQESNTKDTEKYYKKAEKDLAQANTALLEIENEYRANFSPMKKDPLEIKDEDGKETENPELARNNSFNLADNKVEEHELNKYIDSWIQETKSIVAAMNDTGKKGIIWVLLMHLIKDDENNSGKYDNLDLDKDFCERFLIAYKNRKTTPTIFFKNILNVSEGTISSNSGVVENFIKKRFMKFRLLTEAAEFQEKELDMPERINIPHLSEKAVQAFWHSLANYFKKEIEVILL